MISTGLCGILAAWLSAPVAGSGEAERAITKEMTVRAPLDEVWNAWTTVEGLTTFFSNGADIQLRVGGKYELYFDLSAEYGLRGAEGCTLLEIKPRERLAFTWNAPPSIPALRNANVRTKVLVQFADLGDGRVHVTLKQTGIKQGADWDKYYAYFDRVWTEVLKSLDENRGKLAALSSAADEAIPRGPTINDFAAFAGRWKGTTSFGNVEMHWSEPRGGLMLGVFRLMDEGGHVVMLKLDMIRETEGGIEFRTRHFSPELTAFEEKDAPIVTRCVSHHGTRFVFEPTAEGTLKRTWLSIDGADGLLAKSELVQDGKTTFFQIEMKRWPRDGS